MNRPPRPAFTLVELLVVAAIMAVFFGLVVNGARSSPSREVARTAQSLASVLLAAQSRAIGSPNGGAVVIDSGTATGSPGICGSVLAADIQDPIVGTTSGIVSGAVALVVTGGPDAAAALESGGYRIQFGGLSGLPGAPYQPLSPWFRLQPQPSNGSTVTATLDYRDTDGQTPLNTVLPQPTAVPGTTGTMAFRAATYPVRSEALLSFPKRAVIDLRYSGCGHNPASQFGAANSIADVTVTFDSVGIVHEVIQGITVRITADPIFLLVTTRDAAVAGTALSDVASFWVVVAPSSGRVVTGRNVPQAGANEAAIRNARAVVSAAVLGAK
jgi:prepilin-type N-terminal cleavage/methylation domain-containing protein